MSDSPISVVNDLAPDASPPSAPLASKAARIWAAAILMLTGLGLGILGGCFMIGVLFTMGLANGPRSSLGSSPDTLLVLATLYIVGFLCFAGALALVALGARGLMNIIHERT